MASGGTMDQLSVGLLPRLSPHAVGGRDPGFKAADTTDFRRRRKQPFGSQTGSGGGTHVFILLPSEINDLENVLVRHMGANVDFEDFFEFFASLYGLQTRRCAPDTWEYAARQGAGDKSRART
jgi:hypothetical protein